MAAIYALFTGTSDAVPEGDVQVCAATGSGKTVSFSVGAATSGVGPICVVVHTNRLKNQWLGSVEEAKGLRFLFGEEWVEENVGICQQDVCDFEGKQIVIAMAPSLVSRKYPKEFYEYFGVVGVDEVHKMATPTFNTVIGLFPAYFHGGLTATPKDGPMGKCIIAHIGEPAITSDQEVMQPKVFRVKFDPGRPVNIVDYTTGEVADDSQRILNPLTRMKHRNEMLADLMFWRGFKRDRQILGLSDRTDQLLALRQMLIDRGVPPEEIGMYVGKYKTGEYKLVGSVDFLVNVTRRDKATKKLATHRDVVTKHLRGLPPFATKRAAEKYVDQYVADFIEENPKLEPEYVRHKSKVDDYWHSPSDEDYEQIEKGCRFVLATYGIFDTGIDIKRLDFGVELSPRGDVAQAVGRILRLMKGKVTPEWYSIFDDLWTNISVQLFGKTETRRYVYKTPLRLEKRRRKSYHKQNAILIGVNNVAEAIEAAKHEARERGQRNRQGRSVLGTGGLQSPQKAAGGAKRYRTLRLRRR